MVYKKGEKFTMRIHELKVLTLYSVNFIIMPVLLKSRKRIFIHLLEYKFI